MQVTLNQLFVTYPYAASLYVAASVQANVNIQAEAVLTLSANEVKKVNSFAKTHINKYPELFNEFIKGGEPEQLFDSMVYNITAIITDAM